MEEIKFLDVQEIEKPIELGDKVTVTHRDGTKRRGIICDLLPETQRGPLVVFYKVSLGGHNYIAYPAYGDTITQGYEPIPESVATICLDPDRGLQGPPVITMPEIPKCKTCKKTLTTTEDIPDGWVCTMQVENDGHEELATHGCPNIKSRHYSHGTGWCGSPDCP